MTEDLRTVQCPECLGMKDLSHLEDIERDGLCKDCKNEIVHENVRADWEMDRKFDGGILCQA